MILINCWRRGPASIVMHLSSANRAKASSHRGSKLALSFRDRLRSLTGLCQAPSKSSASRIRAPRALTGSVMWPHFSRFIIHQVVRFSRSNLDTCGRGATCSLGPFNGNSLDTFKRLWFQQFLIAQRRVGLPVVLKSRIQQEPQVINVLS